MDYTPEEFVKAMAKSLAYELSTSDIGALREFLGAMHAEIELMDKVLQLEDVSEQERLISESYYCLLDEVANMEVSWKKI